MHQVTPSKKKIILIVEDDLSIRETLGYTLELEGYPVVTAPTKGPTSTSPKIP